jgi:hypothetical protein
MTGAIEALSRTVGVLANAMCRGAIDDVGVRHDDEC